MCGYNNSYILRKVRIIISAELLKSYNSLYICSIKY